MGPIFVDLFGAREKNGYPIIPDARFEGLLSSMKSHMGDEETPGLLWFREVLEKSSSRNWTLMLAAASHILLKGNLKEDVYEVGNASLPSQYQDKIEYESFLNLNPTEPVRDAFFRLEAKLQNGDRTRFGSYLKEKTGYSLRDFKKDPKLFAVYADELVQAMADFPFEAPGEAGILLNGLEYRRGKGIEFSFISRNADDFRLGNCVGDCTAYRDAGSHTFWSVATYLSHPFYQTLLVYYDGRLIDKLDLTLIEIEGKIYLNIDAHEPIPNLEKSESVSMELLSKREEFFLAAIERVKDIARAMGVAGIRAVGTSNRKYIEGVVRKQKLNGNPEEEKVIIPGLYQKYFGTRAAGVEVRLLGGVDVPNRYVSEQTPLLEPLLTHWRVKPEIFFQATSMGDTSDTLRAFGSYVEQRIQKLHGEEHSQIENLLKDEKFEECVALLLSDKTYKSLTSKISRRHHALGLTEENFREDLKTVLTYIYSPSRIFGTARLYDIPMDSPTGHSELRVQFNKTRADQSSLTEQSTQTNADRAKSHETAALLNQFYDQLLIKGERLAPDAHTFFPITIDLSRYETEISKIRAIKIPYEFKKHIVFKIDHFRSQTEFIRAAMEDITGTLSPFLRALASDEVEVDYTQGESWENLITNWPLWGAETSPHSKAFNFYRNHVDPLIIETIEKQIEKRQKELAERPVVILDLFAGDGSLIERLAHKFQKRWPKLSFKFHIVDTQARLVERARLRLKDLPVQVHQADIPSVIQLSDLINGQADFVIVSGGLAESVISQRNAKLVLQRIYRVLKSGGIALITGYTHILFNRREFKKVYGFQVLQTSIPENVFATEELPDQFYVVQKPIKEEAAPRFRRRVSADDVFAIPRRSELRSAVHVTPEKNGAVTIEIPKALLGKERAVRLEAVLKGRSAHTPLESKGKDSYSFYVPNAYEFQIILEAIGIPSEIQYDKVVSVKGLMLSFFDDWVELRKKPVEEFAQGFTELLINLNRVPQTVRANAAPLRPEVPSEFIASLQRGRSELRHIAAQHSLRRLVEAIRDFIWNLSVRLTPPSLGREISIYFINGPSSTKKIIHPHKRESMAGNLIRLLNRSQALVMIVNPMFVLGYLRGKGPERRFNHSNVSFHLNHVLFKDNQFLKYSIHIFQFFAERVKLATEILQNYSPFALFGIFRSLSWPFAHVGMLAGGASFVNLFLLNKLLIFNQITFPGRLERHRSELRNTLLEKTEIADPNGVPRSEVRANPDETEARVWTNPARYEEFQAGDIWEFKGERHEIVRRLDRSHVFLVRDSQGKPWVLKLFYEREKRRLVQRFLEDVKGKPGIMQGIIYRQSGHDVLKLEFAGDRTLKEFLNEGQAAAMPLAARYQLARDIWMIFQTLTELNYDQGDFGAHNIVLDRLDNDRWKPTLIDEVNLERLGDLTTDDYETRYIEYLDLTHAVLSVIVGYYLVPQDEGEIQAIEPTFGNEIANAVFDWSYLHEKDDRRGKRDVRHLRVLTENVRDLLQSGFTPQAASRAELQSSRAGLTTVRSSQRAAARAELPSASGLEKGRPRTVGPQDTQTSSSLRAELREEKAEKGPWKQLPYYLSIIRSSTSSQTEKLSAIHSIRSGFASYPNTPTDDFIQLFLTEFKRIDSDDFKKEEYREALLRGLLDYGFLPSSAVREEAFRILQSHDWVAFQIVLDGLVSEFPDQITDEWFDLLKERVFGETPIAESILFFFGDILDENAEELQRFKPKIMNDAVFLTRLRTKVDRVLAVQWHALENQPHAGRPSVRSVANTWLLRWALDPSRKPGDKKPNEAALIIVLTARSKSGQKAVLPTGRKFLSRLDGEEIQQLKSVIESERVTPYDLIVHYMREGKRMIFWGYYQMAADRTFKRFSRDLIDLVDNEEITHILLPFYEQEFRDFLTAELSASKANLALASFFGEGNARLFYETFRYLDGKIRFIYKGLGGEKSDTEVFEGEELLLDRSAAALHNLLRTNPKAKILAIGSDWSAIKNHRKTSGTEGEIDLSLAWLLAGRIGSEKVASIFEMDRQALHHVKAQGVNNLIDAIDQFTAIKSFGLPIIRTPVEKLAYDEDYPDDTFGNAIDAIIVRMSDDDDNDEYFIGPDIPEEPEVRPVPGTPASSRTVQLSRAELPHHPIGDGAVPTVIEANSVNSMGRLGLHQPINQDFLELIRKAGAVRSSQRAAARAELPSASGLEKGRPRAVGPQDTQTSSSLRTELRTEQAMEKEPAALQSNRLWWMRLASSFIWGFVVRLIPKSVKTEFNKRRPPARQSEFFQSLPRSLQAAVGGYFISDLVGPKKLIENVMVVVKHKFFDSVDQDKRAEIEYEVSYQLEELYDFLLENQVHYPGFVFTYFVPAIVQWVDSVEDLHRAIGELASYQDFSKIDSLALAFIKLFILKTKTPAEMVLDESNMAQKMAPISAILGMLRASDSVQEVLWLGPQTVQVVQDAVVKMLNGRPLLFSSRFTLPIHWENIFLENWTDIFLKAHQAIHFGKEFAIQTKTNRWGRMAVMDDELEVMPVNQSLSLTGDSAEEARAELRTILILIAQVLALLALPFFVNVILNKWTERSERHKKMQVSEKERVLQEALAQYRSFHNSYLGNLLARSQPSDERTSLLQDAYQKIVQTNSFDHEELRKGSVFGYSPSDLIQRILYNDYVHHIVALAILQSLHHLMVKKVRDPQTNVLAELHTALSGPNGQAMVDAYLNQNFSADEVENVKESYLPRLITIHLEDYAKLVQWTLDATQGNAADSDEAVDEFKTYLQLLLTYFGERRVILNSLRRQYGDEAVDQATALFDQEQVKQLNQGRAELRNDEPRQVLDISGLALHGVSLSLFGLTFDQSLDFKPTVIGKSFEQAAKEHPILMGQVTAAFKKHAKGNPQDFKYVVLDRKFVARESFDVLNDDPQTVVVFGPHYQNLGHLILNAGPVITLGTDLLFMQLISRSWAIIGAGSSYFHSARVYAKEGAVTEDAALAEPTDVKRNPAEEKDRILDMMRHLHRDQSVALKTQPAPISYTKLGHQFPDLIPEIKRIFNWDSNGLRGDPGDYRYLILNDIFDRKIVVRDPKTVVLLGPFYQNDEDIKARGPVIAIGAIVNDAIRSDAWVHLGPISYVRNFVLHRQGVTIDPEAIRHQAEIFHAQHPWWYYWWAGLIKLSAMRISSRLPQLIIQRPDKRRHLPGPPQSEQISKPMMYRPNDERSELREKRTIAEPINFQIKGRALYPASGPDVETIADIAHLFPNIEEFVLVDPVYHAESFKLLSLSLKALFHESGYTLSAPQTRDAIDPNQPLPVDGSAVFQAANGPRSFRVRIFASDFQHWQPPSNSPFAITLVNLPGEFGLLAGEKWFYPAVDRHTAVGGYIMGRAVSRKMNLDAALLGWKELPTAAMNSQPLPNGSSFGSKWIYQRENKPLASQPEAHSELRTHLNHDFHAGEVRVNGQIRHTHPYSFVGGVRVDKFLQTLGIDPQDVEKIAVRTRDREGNLTQIDRAKTTFGNQIINLTASSINIVMHRTDSRSEARSQKATGGLTIKTVNRILDPKTQISHYERFNQEGRQGDAILSYASTDPLYLEFLTLSILKKLPHEAKALSVGEGRGHLAARLKKNGVHMTAMDITAANIPHAKENEVELVIADANQHFPFEANAFDAVIFNESIGAMQLAHVAREAQRVLKPGGVIVIAHYEYKHINALTRTDMMDQTKYVLYTREEVNSALASAGFEEPEVTEVPPIHMTIMFSRKPDQKNAQPQRSELKWLSSANEADFREVQTATQTILILAADAQLKSELRRLTDISLSNQTKPLGAVVLSHSLFNYYAAFGVAAYQQNTPHAVIATTQDEMRQIEAINQALGNVKVNGRTYAALIPFRNIDDAVGAMQSLFQVKQVAYATREKLEIPIASRIAGVGRIIHYAQADLDRFINGIPELAATLSRIARVNEKIALSV
ncbi:MAG: hypothetical protein COV74_03700 [Candidatus Omnitrophica bacterium CG11_big_fil_rev_8_21_14_0_20_45_26]|uniref:Methyltransferase domain-containing protein n=1 Tax=Candidatus Abzuiibacterium crystallinum TaxID=1974748 RepID=A0A2H0LQG4_9BACT|nr:MAG: hypothetical protein COV74_03700 [Candidatus Omnitrophica bacterium CG11_big_fil_rev_8_21_14_0_20_45_26]